MLTLRNTPDGSGAASDTVTIEIDGKAIAVPPGTSVAAAVMSVVPGHTRTTPAGETPRAPYCLMGVCFDCLMEIDGKANQRACQTTVEDGMCIRLHHDKRWLQT